MPDRIKVGVTLVLVSLMAAFAFLIVYGMTTLSPWCGLAIPAWIGLAMIWWDALTE